MFEQLLSILFLVLSLFTEGSQEIVVKNDPEAAQQAVVTHVVDGDTIEVELLNSGNKETVRYIGIDTPEPYREGEPECGSHEATSYNKELVEGKTVELFSDREDRDKYGRLLRYVYVTDESASHHSINRQIISAGFAHPLTIAPNDTYADEFRRLSNEAKRANVGLFAVCADF